MSGGNNNRRVRKSQRAIPVAWARAGPASEWIARVVPMREPPVLILAMPRSGSSWLGEMLGLADDAAYLREPVTQSLRRAGYEGMHLSIPEGRAGALFERAARRALIGAPCFDGEIVRYPEQWRICGRSRRRLVVKEILLAAASRFIESGAPRVILLIRHPAAVAASYRRLGWLPHGTFDPARFGETQAAQHAARLAAAWAYLKEYPSTSVVRYEDLCANPLRLFESLYAFAGCTWTDAVAERIRAHSAGGDRSRAYSTSRHSVSMRDAWKQEVPRDEIASIRAAYGAAQLPWYERDEDWRQ